jgi:hypothetical protein
MSFQYQRTQHGDHSGGKGDKGSKQSVLKPIARWLQCRMFFLCGGLDQLEKMDGWEQNNIFCATSNQEFAEDIHDH